MPTINTDFYPATRGQNLGRVGQEWNGEFFNLTIAPGGSFSGADFLTGNGNATALQGRPLDATAPADNQVIVWDGTTWIPGSGDADALIGIPVTGVPTVNQALIFDGVSWSPANQSGGGGGGVAQAGYVVTSFSSTPVFTPNPVGSCQFQITLTGNVFSSTFTTTSLVAGAEFKFIIIQDATGGRVFTFPDECRGTAFVSTVANQVTVQSFIWSGSVLYASSPGVSYP